MIAAHASPLSIPPLDSPRMGSGSGAAPTAPSGAVTSSTSAGHAELSFHPESPTPAIMGPGPQRVGRTAGSRSSSPLRRPDSRGLGHSASAARLGGVAVAAQASTGSGGRRSTSLSRSDDRARSTSSRRETGAGGEIARASPAAAAAVAERWRREATAAMDVDHVDEAPVKMDVESAKGEQVELEDAAKTRALAKLGGLLSAKRDNRPVLSLDEGQQKQWSEMLTRGSGKIVSDASTLPRSTNMGIKYTSAHAHGYVDPASVAAAKERRGYECEQDDGEKKVISRPTPRTQFFKAIPCIFVDHIASALAFYTRVLGFTLRSKADATRAHLVRAVPSSPVLGASAGTGTGTQSQRRRPGEGPSVVEGVEIFLRTAPKDVGAESGEGRPGPQTLWIMVQSVDEYHAEISVPLARFQPRADEYFPEVHLGQGGISGKPQNKAWGNREMTVTDPDGNKLVFFTPLDR